MALICGGGARLHCQLVEGLQARLKSNLPSEKRKRELEALLEEAQANRASGDWVCHHLGAKHRQAKGWAQLPSTDANEQRERERVPNPKS